MVIMIIRVQEQTQQGVCSRIWRLGMSTITVTNIKATGETASRSATSIAAAWANANGTGTIALRDSFNVSSITDEGVGDITHTFY